MGIGIRAFERLRNVAAAALLGGALASFPAPVLAEVDYDRDGDAESPKEVNDPIPPAAMPKNTPPGAVPTPRGTPEGMGNETDFTKTPGDDDPSDGVDEPGRNPMPGAPRPAPGAEKH